MRIVKLLLLLTILSLGVVSAASYLRPSNAASSGKYFDYVVTILMENNDLSSVLSQGTFQASLASQYTLSTGYSAVAHPSEPNYSALFSGHITPNSDDGICCGQDSGPNLVDRLEAQGLTWKAFAEDLSNGSCSGGGIDTDHFPFLYFSDITGSPARCANLLGATAGSDTELVSALNAASGWPNYIWLTPNTSNDAHDTSIAFGDSYLSGIVPQILGSNLFRSQRAALFIVYDEGNDASCSSGGSDCVYASWSGPVTKKGFSSTNAYSHYSYLHTIEDNWGLSTLTSNDAGAPVMSEFFASSGPTPLSTGFTISPSPAQVGQTVTFRASTSGGTSPYGDSWNFGDGSSGSGTTVTHSYSSTGTFHVTLTTTDSASPANTATATNSITVNPAPLPGTLSISFTQTPSSPSTGQVVTFSADVTGGTPPYGVGWDFGDGGISVGLSTTHTFASQGTFNVTAAVTDSGSPAVFASTSRFVTVGSGNPPPASLSANFSFQPTSPTVGSAVSFTSSVTGGTAPYSYQWDFGDSVGTATSANPSYTYSTAGTFTVTLTVTDSASASVSASHNVVVASGSTPPPALSVGFSFNPSNPSTGDSVSFTSTVTGGTSPYSYQWDFGDSAGTDTTANPSHSYSSSGTFTIKLTVTDSSGGSASVSHHIVVVGATPPPPTGTSGSYCTGLTRGPAGDLEPMVSVDYVNPSSSASFSTSALFDSGSTYSLAPTSLATSLGLTMSDGTPVTLTSVSGTPIQAVVFHLTLTFGGSLTVVNVPVAFTDSTNQFLIGRLGFLDQVSVTFDSTAQTICLDAGSPSGGSSGGHGSNCPGANDDDPDGDGDDNCGSTTGSSGGDHEGSGTGDSGDSDGDDSGSEDFVGIATTSNGGVLSGLPVLLTMVPLAALGGLVLFGIVKAPSSIRSKTRKGRER